MVETRAEGSDLTLPELLARRARSASDERLALDAGGGLLAGTLVLAFRVPGWPVLVSAAAIFVAFGVWGIADRTIGDENLGARASRVVRALRAGAAGLGIASALALVGTGMALMLGTWIS
jgi:hypothetical protein